MLIYDLTYTEEAATEITGGQVRCTPPRPNPNEIDIGLFVLNIFSDPQLCGNAAKAASDAQAYGRDTYTLALQNAQVYQNQSSLSNGIAVAAVS